MVREIETVEYKKIEPKIKLIKGQRDTYGWELTLPKNDGMTDDSWVKELFHINALLREEVDNLTKLNKEANNGRS